LLIADPGQHIIWSLDLANRKLTTLVGNGSVGNLDAQGSKSSFNHPTGIVVTQNNIVYVSDTYNHRIRTFSLDDPLVMVSNYVGTGQRGFADDRGFPYMLCEPMGLALSRGIGINTNTLYIADHCNHLIRHVGTRGIINKYAGGDAGQQGYQDGLSARFNHPSALIFDALNNIYIADTDNHRIRRIDTSRRVSTISGDGQPGTRDGMYFEGNISNPQLNKPSDIAIDKYNQLFIVDTQNHRIRKINLQNNTTTTIAGSNRGFLDGSCNKALFSYPGGIAIDSEGHIYIGDTENQSIRIIVDKSN
jgi:sugar lactone lactonase YvrE